MPEEIRPDTSFVAILGFSLHSVDAMERFNRRYVIVADPAWEAYCEEHDIPFVPWKFEQLNETSVRLYDQLKKMGVEVAVPLYEETVEWAGALNSRLLDKPRLYPWSYLFRDKAMMKRRAQMSNIPVGVFEEAFDHADVRRFLLRVNEVLLKLDGDPNDPIHMKPFNLAGSAGHRVIRHDQDLTEVTEKEFPCLLESHLDGKEFACEIFIHDGKIRFMNISEYVHLGHSVFLPPSPELEERREQIRAANQRLIEAFEIDNGFIHPEWFLTSDEKLHFGEVAYRVPGGNAFELIERAYGFNAYQGQVLCMDPKTTEEEIEAFFPDERSAAGHAGCLLVYPLVHVINGLEFPEELENHPAFERHDLFMPAERTVAKRTAFGTHYGNIFFYGEDPEEIRRLCLEYEDHHFYV